MSVRAARRAGELAVAGLVAKGRTNGEISAELFLSVATVKAYVSRLLTKLELNNRVQVALLVQDARPGRSLAEPHLRPTQGRRAGKGVRSEVDTSQERR